MSINLSQFISACLIFMCAMVFSTSSFSQEPDEEPKPAETSQTETLSVSAEEEPIESLPIQEQMYRRVQAKNPEVKPSQLGSLFLTNAEESLVISARQGLITRPPTDDEFAMEQAAANKEAVKTGPREVVLGGILYVSSNEWTVWINSEKITPKNIPEAIVDIRVSKDSIKLKWFDVQTNQIFPIKLRTHQRFNLDTRMFLPG